MTENLVDTPQDLMPANANIHLHQHDDLNYDYKIYQNFVKQKSNNESPSHHAIAVPVHTVRRSHCTGTVSTYDLCLGLSACYAGDYRTS